MGKWFCFNVRNNDFCVKNENVGNYEVNLKNVL